MKNALSLLALLVASTLSNAQPWLNGLSKPMKYLDAVNNYQRKSDKKSIMLRDVKNEEVVVEDEDYQFDRWCWYWKQHLDSAGYLVGGGKTIREWEQYAGKNNTAAKTTATANWVFQGPSQTTSGYNGLGRLNVVAFDPVDSNTLYVGSASGSTWKTTNGGTTWKCLYDNMATLSVNDIRVNPRNRNTVYVSTGDNNNSDDNSIGVLKSYDGGTTWTRIGPFWTLDSFIVARTMIINPLDTNKLILGTSNGLYRTNNGGASWMKVSNYNFRQVLYSPGDTGILHATAVIGSSAQILVSNNGGYTWTITTTFTNARRINIAVCPAVPYVVKAIAAHNNGGLLGIYNSTDYGATFTALYTDNSSCDQNLLSGDNSFPTSSCGGNGWYDLCIAIDPLNADNVTIGGINNYHSVDGGSTWTIANQWYNSTSGLQVVHADKHWLAYNPLNNALYLGCDGGVYKTYNPVANNWKDLSNGLGITQFYRNAVNNDVTYCIGGSQDNGTKKLSAGVATNLTGGDGMQCLINYSDPANMFYTSTQNGYVRVTYDGGANFTSITDDLPTPGAWITPYALHPSNPATLIIGYKGVHVTNNNGASWTPISTNFSSSNIEILTMALSNPNYIFAVRDNGGLSAIHYTSNFGTSWSIIPHTFTNYISDLVVDPKNEKRFWVTLSGYSAAKVYSYDITTSMWTNESAGLPNIPANCMVIDTFSGTKYVGTDAAVFYKTSTMSTWGLYNTLLPNVNVYDLNINHGTNEIWAATYGRGMWKSPKADLSPVRVSEINNSSNMVLISPNPSHGAFRITAPGINFRNSQVTIRILTLEGKTVLNTYANTDDAGKIEINGNKIAPGFYVCEVNNGKEIVRGRFVMQ